MREKGCATPKCCGIVTAYFGLVAETQGVYLTAIKLPIAWAWAWRENASKQLREGG